MQAIATTLQKLKNPPKNKKYKEICCFRLQNVDYMIRGLQKGSMCLLVQAKKQCKHQYEQEDLLCLKLDHLPLSQCSQISVPLPEKDYILKYIAHSKERITEPRKFITPFQSMF